MGTFLFDNIVFGPVKSRRLGESLGINLLPVNAKVCNFDCIYCECGFNGQGKGKLPSRDEVKILLKEKLTEFKAKGKEIDAITYAGNGEPTLHKEFGGIIEDCYHLRNEYFPKAQIALLTNATTIANKAVLTSFKYIDQNILKLDSVHEETVRRLNCPTGSFNLAETIALMKKLQTKIIIQTMFVRGKYKGEIIDNTSEEEIIPWLKTLKDINPAQLMIYTIARDTPIDTLEKVPLNELEAIARRVKMLGIDVQISA